MVKFCEDKKYIEMCRKAEEIQALWNPQKGDFFLYADFTYAIGDCYIDTPSIDTVGCGCCSHSIINFGRVKEKKNAIWLPCQDQLQEMILPKGSLQLLGCMLFEAKIIAEEQPNVFDSIEQFLLATVMKHKFNKTWNDTKGVWE